jgi:hypothetical protein
VPKEGTGSSLEAGFEPSITQPVKHAFDLARSVLGHLISLVRQQVVNLLEIFSGILKASLAFGQPS